MTRRIAIAILITTWSALIVIGVSIYVATRHTLLTDLDDSIVARAMALPHGLGTSSGTISAVPEGDRYIVRDGLGRTATRPTTSAATFEPVVKSKAFIRLADGSRLRTITIALIGATTDPASATTITYSTSVDRFDRLLNRLVIWLVAIGTGSGASAAAAAIVLSRLSLRPLLNTANIIGGIDERNLDRRIEINALPTELAPMATRLNEMLARLETAFEQGTRFLADASHELRTPVAALMTAIEVSLRHPRTAEASRSTLQTCLSDVKTLRYLVDRLMQQVRGESTALTEPSEPFDLVVLLNECVESLLRSKGEKTLEIRRHFPQSLQVHTQLGRVRGIVTNLLSNAFDYTPSGGSVDVSCEVGDELVISVADSGPGISTDLAPRLFMPFSSGDPHRSVQNGHLGLGLSIAQAHAKALGGRCAFENGQLAGTTFSLYLPATLIVPISKEVAVHR